MKYVPLQAILSFLSDEAITPRVGSTDPEKYHMSFNDPFIDDSKHRAGIARIFIESTGEYETVFNGFKSSALLGDNFHGSFYKFVKLLKDFDTIHEAIEYFDYRYIYPEFSAEELLQWNVSKEKIEEYTPINHDVYFPDSFERHNVKSKLHFKYSKYMWQRGVSPERMSQLKIFIDHYTQRIVFPVYEDNKLVFYSKRSIDPDEEYKWIKLKNTKSVFPVWNLDNAKIELRIFEGIFDAIHFDNGVAIFGAFWNNKLREKILKKHFFKIIVCMDNDTPGQLAKIKIAEDLIHYHDNVHIYNYKGIKEKDFGDIIKNKGSFEDKRVIKWNYEAKVKLKMGIYS